ncbi:MAG: gliding motility-associated C-terminal domain-containing protein [Bacteroidetes bacterium]|nr:MAG: gliding motility-associated C-terminal domain-containing protein [Bacteroidota bacterium]
MRWLSKISALFLFFLCQQSNAQAPFLRRVCVATTNNELVWNNPTYPCTDFKFYLIWGRNGTSGPFVLVDTIKNIASENYTHVNANIGPGSPNWYYFIERRDSCAPYNYYSDTLRIDDTPTEQTSFDSVSIDIATNKVIIGWPSNKSVDFNKYYIFQFTGTYILLTSSGIIDTFYQDNNNDPSVGILSYDIYTTDSCGNPSLLGLSKHSTIFLQHTIDTCKRQYNLNWSHYVGWTGIEKYHIFEKTETSDFRLIDSVDGSINTYTGSYSNKASHEYYVRAIKLGNKAITSSSNKIQFTTRVRNEPAFISINHISSLAPISKNLSFSFQAEADKDVSSYEVSILDSGGVLKESLNLNKADIGKEITLSSEDHLRWYITVAAKDYCNNAYFYGDTSTNIVLAGIDTLQSRQLFWNPYSFWKAGVENYQISRGTGNDGLFLLSPFTQTFDTLFKDTQTIDDIQNEGVCYFVEAIPKGNPQLKSRSNMVCLSTSFLVFIPNAFAPNGINSLFRPEGSSIDYQKSTFTIYNRWGQEIYSGIINNGWNGLDNDGEVCSSGVYHYNIEIISSKNEKKNSSGYVTLIR